MLRSTAAAYAAYAVPAPCAASRISGVARYLRGVWNVFGAGIANGNWDSEDSADGVDVSGSDASEDDVSA